MTPVNREYALAIAEDYLEKRGYPTLLLTSAEFALIKRWQEQQIPLRIVLRGIEDCFASKPRGTVVKSLYYCERAVEDAVTHWAKAVGGFGHDEVAR